MAKLQLVARDGYKGRLGSRDPDNGVYKGPIQDEIEKAIISEYKRVVSQDNRGAAARANSNAPTPTGNRPGSPLGEGPAW